MAKRSVKGFIAGLKSQIDAEHRKLNDLCAERSSAIAEWNAKIGAQAAAVEALKGVLVDMAPAVVRKAKVKS